MSSAVGNRSASSGGQGASSPAATSAAKEETASRATRPSHASSGQVHPTTVGGSSGVAASCGRYQAKAVATTSGVRTVPGSAAVTAVSRAPRRSAAAARRPPVPGRAPRPRPTGGRSGVRCARPPPALRHRRGAGSASQVSYAVVGARPARSERDEPRAAYAHSSTKVACSGRAGVQPAGQGGDVPGRQAAGAQRPDRRAVQAGHQDLQVVQQPERGAGRRPVDRGPGCGSGRPAAAGWSRRARDGAGRRGAARPPRAAGSPCRCPTDAAARAASRESTGDCGAVRHHPVGVADLAGRRPQQPVQHLPGRRSGAAPGPRRSGPR